MLSCITCVWASLSSFFAPFRFDRSIDINRPAPGPRPTRPGPRAPKKLCNFRAPKKLWNFRNFRAINVVFFPSAFSLQPYSFILHSFDFVESGIDWQCRGSIWVLQGWLVFDSSIWTLVSDLVRPSAVRLCCWVLSSVSVCAGCAESLRAEA